ncbi:MAG: hypothetical protein IJ251_06150 [Oscillospiraceae bacterium]|nr:hypothetical protein [Oscillospiraceae bacterium]
MDKKFLRIVIFLILGVVITGVSDIFLPSPFDSILPSAAQIIITFIMQRFIEHNTPSFFVAANYSRSFTGGAVTAFMIYAVPLYILWTAGQISAGTFKSGMILRLVCALLDYGTLPALLIFGYVFHMIWSHFSVYRAIGVCSALYVAYFAYSRQIISAGFMSRPINIVFVSVNMILLAITLSLLEYAYGDIISVFVCLTVTSLLESFATMFDITHFGLSAGHEYGGLFISPIVSIMLLIRILTLFIEIMFARRKK